MLLDNGVVKPAVVETSKTLCRACRQRVVPSSAIPKPEPLGTDASSIKNGSIREIVVQDGRIVRTDENGLPIDVLDGSLYALLRVIDDLPATNGDTPSVSEPQT